MGYVFSTKPDITEGIPASMGGGSAETVRAPSGWDVSFGAEGFNLRVTEQTPYQRSTERPKKQQIDTSEQAGEQTLGNWWTRSQDTWDNGAGVRWFEPGSAKDTLGRFHESMSIDVWTAGELRLLHAMDIVSPPPGADTHLITFDTAEDQGFVEFRGEVARRITAGGVSAYAETGTSGTEFTMPTVTGDSVFCGSNIGVWQFVPELEDLDLVITHDPGAIQSRVWWSKNRLIIAYGPTLYSAPRSASGALTSQTVLFTHPDPSWRWVGLTEASTAIMAAGSSTGESAVYRLPLVADEDGNPQIMPGQQVIAMPNGEIIHSMGSYLGTILVLGTSYGVRVGQMASDGDAALGPLMETSAPVQDMVFRDRFAYVTLTRGMADGGSGAARIDLSAPIGETGRFAWATDVRVPSGTTETLESIAMMGDRVALSNASGTYIESADRYESQGFLDTGRIRFATVERKAFCWLRIVSIIGTGRILITAIDPSTNETNIVAMDETFATDDDISIRIPQRPLDQYISLRIYLEPGEVGHTVTPVVGGLVDKAQPASSRIRLYQYPVQIADTEKNRVGETRSSGPGSGYRRLAELERLEETGVPVQVQDSRTGETYRGQIDSIDFTTSIPPDKGAARPGYAGVALVTVRKLG